MLRFTAAFASLILATIHGPAAAQEGKNTKAPPITLTEAQKEARIDQILRAWENRMSQIDALSLKVTRTITEPIRKSQTQMTGIANLYKPDLAQFHLQDPNNPEKFERFVSNKGKLFAYSPKTKTIEVADDSKRSLISQNLFFSVLRGMKASEARERFHITWEMEEDVYAYIKLEPKRDSDKQDFTVARLTIVIDGKQYPQYFMLPRQIEFFEPNKTHFVYVFSQIVANPKDLTPANFEVKLPQGWKFQELGSTDKTPGQPTNGPKTIEPINPSKVRE